MDMYSPAQELSLRRKLLFRLHHEAERREFSAAQQAHRRRVRMGDVMQRPVAQPTITRTKLAPSHIVSGLATGAPVSVSADFGADDTFDFKPLFGSPPRPRKL